jgi:hypothetical protein
MRRNPSLGWIRFRRAVAPHSEAVSAGAIGVLRPVQIAVKPIQTRCQPDANSEQKESNRTGNEGPEIMAERHNAPQHNLHANQAGNAGDCISSAHSSQPWRRVGRFFATTVLASFVLNEVWEMAQMSAYVETAGHSWMSTLGLCTLAAVGDVGIILGIYAAGALAAGDLFWGWRGRWNIYATVAVLGLAYAALVEHAALAAGRWSYTEGMPVVSVLGAGLWPLLQMTLLPPFTFLFARWWAGRSATKGPLW